MKSLTILFICLLSQTVKASALGIPDGDTALLMAIVGNTADQLVRLENLITKQSENTKVLRDAVDIAEEKFEVADQLKSIASNSVSILEEKPEDMAQLNDAIENMIDQKERLKEMVKKSQKAEQEAETVKEQNKDNNKATITNSRIAERQIVKSFGTDRKAKNTGRLTAQNTALLLKETVVINNSINTTNSLLSTQNQLMRDQNNVLINDEKSKLNALSISNNKAKK